MRRTMSAAKVPVIRFYDRSHTFAILALAARVPVMIVGEMLGHKRVKLTIVFYVYMLPGMHESAVETLKAAF